MAKQDVIDAINSTIVENGIKGITADSLRNLLIMMTEGGSGSGDGALRVIVPETMLLGLTIAESGELSPSSWATMRPELEAESGADLSEYEIAVNASFTHNAEVAQQILAKAKSGQGVSIVLDQTPYFPAAVNIQLAADSETAVLVSELIYSATQPAGFRMEYFKPTPEGEAAFGGEQIVCTLVPVGGAYTEFLGQVNYPSNMTIDLLSDGSLIFTPNETDTESGS